MCLIIIQWEEDLEYEEFNCYTSRFLGYGCNFQVWFRWKERKANKEISFLFCVSKGNGKKWKISPLTAIFLKWKDQKCLFQFWFFFFTFCFKWNQSRCTEIDFNFQFSLMDENRMDERHTHRAKSAKSIKLWSGNSCTDPCLVLPRQSRWRVIVPSFSCF